MHARRLLAILALLWAALWSTEALAQTHHMKAELVAESPVEPGQTETLALHFTPEPGWHGYWLNPGDAGYGMDLKWTLPEGWSVGEPEYPVPHRLVVGGLMNHVYEADYAVLLPLKIPAGAAVQNAAPIEVKGSWLVCTDEICVPEQADLKLDLSKVAAGDARFDRWRAAIPAELDRTAAFEAKSDLLRLAIPVPASLQLGDPHVFIDQVQLVDYAAPQKFYRDGDTLVIEIPRKGIGEEPSAITGILDFGEAGQGVRFAAAPGAVPAGGTPIGGGSAGAFGSIWLLLGAALLGGLILNVMPCVFPILSLKAMSLARAGESGADARREGLAYTAGVVLAVLALGVLLLALRAAGNEVGWAFQLQEPGVVVALLVLATAITANLAGLFELPSLSITRGGGKSSAFATGLLAAFVATPCTGPFMAAAMGAALLLPWWQGLLLFAALGLGLALPFLLLGFVPPLRKMLPKPGKWMDTFKRVMAVPMGLTALALLWLTWRSGGTRFAFYAFAVTIAVVALLVMVGRMQRKGQSGGWRNAGIGLASLTLFAVFALPQAYEQTKSSASSAGLIAATPFSEAALAEARADGKPVFVWFTADWCLTCKVNEGLAIEREATKAAFEKAGVVPLVGDWTRRDPEITKFLTAQGAAGVPLYLWYPAGGGDAQQLPQVLTPDTLVDLAGALAEAPSAKVTPG